MKKQRWLQYAAGLACAGIATIASAACPSDLDAATVVASYMNRQAIGNPPPMSLDDAQCGRDKIVRFLGQQLGPVVGYKAGLTNPAVQKRFNHAQPVRGVLFKDMLLPDGAEVPARFGARPVFEADLLVRVKSSAIHRARTPEEVMKHIDAVIPFIELPDLIVQEPGKLNGATLTYLNVGARLGVMGKPLPMSAALGSQLPGMTVRMLDGEGHELDHGKGSDVMEHPLNAVIWLAQDIARAGGRLRAGDLLSLGSFSKLTPPKPGTDIRVVYEGLDGTPTVSVKFR
ncbi:fumarylacetoacetate hydrolase [Noviherbaspirillum sp.]|uniref:2-keto-4-pentenoate hydratase n=1 Tax=Noviherbaspirillum sp. TaxID=1926288 RepID=UPI002B4A884F|nr:fumarylacetoacetate hydrolase [Noviherbaspirillum sp.]HJV82414.1 fumarylacetoacetate hydrolase [Noviherbaspirillum sp.]